MKTRYLLAAALAVTTPLALALPAAAERPDRQQTLSTTLSGAEEVPSPGDPDGTGTAVLDVDAKTGEICYTITVVGIDPATAAHIHEAPAGSAGPVVQGLDAPSDGSSEGCVTNRKLSKDLLKDPSDYYVNVHNAAFPAGAVRGQLG